MHKAANWKITYKFIYPPDHLTNTKQKPSTVLFSNDKFISNHNLDFAKYIILNLYTVSLIAASCELRYFIMRL